MGRVANAMQWAETKGRDRGLRGSSSVWLAIWVLSGGYRILKRLLREKPVVIREELKPGEQLVVTHFGKGAAPPEPPSGRRRRRR